MAALGIIFLIYLTTLNKLKKSVTGNKDSLGVGIVLGKCSLSKGVNPL